MARIVSRTILEQSKVKFSEFVLEEKLFIPESINLAISNPIKY
jgi:hypothetical protein